MTRTERLIRKYGIRKLARELGVEPSTVMRWAQVGRVSKGWRAMVQGKIA